MDNENNQQNHQTPEPNNQPSRINTVIGIASMVLGAILLIVAYRTILHIAYCIAGLFLVLFGIIKLSFAKNSVDFFAKAQQAFSYGCSLIKRTFCACSNKCFCPDKDSCNCSKKL